MVELVLNLVFIGASLLADIKLYNTMDTKFPQQLGQIIPIMFREEGYNLFTLSTPPYEDGKCKYTGFAVPYERTWEEVTESGGVRVVNPPEPGKITGYAMVINKKTCPGKEPEPMFRVDTRDERGILFNKGQMQKGYFIVSRNYASLKEEDRPKWIEQALVVLDKASATNLEAKAFMDYTREAATKAAPKQSAVAPNGTKLE
ncbi:hypothetical protein LZ012_05715 [Dechloromonas sp. XY25]|uniref:Uncharacterized protein n=1 Tax=Dechloromonas hankyongensis TaxID=2908002 RepID=A0ABS9K069_9RHOO|nr:hypothetical protein [Dechloromonas hankyongensis]MCG2576489.1 hypothetical protein [Dechloromonas hankyongensis]